MKFRSSSKKSASTSCQGEDQVDGVTLKWLQSAGLQHLASPVASLDQQQQLHDLLLQSYGGQAIFRNEHFNCNVAQWEVVNSSGESSKNGTGRIGNGLLDLKSAGDDTNLLSEELTTEPLDLLPTSPPKGLNNNFSSTVRGKSPIKSNNTIRAAIDRNKSEKITKGKEVNKETMGKVPQELSKLTPPEILKTEYITVTNKQSNEKSTDSVLALEKKVGVKAKDEDMTVSKDVDVVAVQFGSPEWSPTRGLYGDYKIIEGFEHKSSTGTHDDDFAFRRDEESSRSSESNTRNKRSLSKMGHISKKSSPSVDNINLDNATPESPTTELNNKFNSSMEDLNELHLSRVSIPSKESIAAENTYKVGVGKMVKSQVVSSPNEINKEINSAIEELSKRHSTRKGRSSSARRNDFLSRESNPVKFRVSGTETEELDPMQFSFYNGSNSNLLTSELEEQSKRPSSSKSIPLSIHRGEFNSEGNNPTKNRVVEIKSETLGSTNISSSRRSESRVKAMSVRRKDINTKETNSDKIRVTGDKSKSIRAKIPAKNEPTVTSKSKEHNLKKASANEQVKKSNEQIHSSISIPIEEALSTCATDVKSEEKNAAKIRVVVRKRPLNKKEMIKKEKDVISVEDIEHITIHEPKVKVDLTAYIEKHEFYFDAVLHEHVTNDEVYNVTVGPSIPTILEQAKITCFAFGPTGSGKTFTMRNLSLRASKDILRLLQKNPRINRNFTLWVSHFEIYGKKIFDLLNERRKLCIREDGNQQKCIVGLQEYEISDIETVEALVSRGNAARSTGSTGANEESSRSHSVLQLAIKQNSIAPTNGTKRKSESRELKNKCGNVIGKISFIDLAGSERGADCTHSDRDKRNEGVEINKSLLALKECIRALDNDQNHIPFRGSKLTEVLHDSFIGDSRTVMICCVSPSTGSCEQTLNTLRYAERVRNLSRDGYQKDQGTEILTESNKMDQRIEKITKIEGENNRELYNPSPEMAENLSVRAIYSSKPEIGESSFRFMSNCDFIGSQEDCDPKGQCKIQNNIAGSFSTSYCSSLDFSAKNWLQNYGKEEQIVQPMDQEAGLNIEKDIQAPLKEESDQSSTFSQGEEYLNDKEIVEKVPGFHESSDSDFSFMNQEQPKFDGNFSFMTRTDPSNSTQIHQQELLNIKPLIEEIYKKQNHSISSELLLESNKKTSSNHQYQEEYPSDSDDIKIIFEVDNSSISTLDKEKEFNLVAENRAILDTLSDSENINKGPEARCSLYEIERNGIDDVDFSYPALSDEEIFVKQMVPQCIEEEALIEKREQRNGVDVSHTTLAKSVERELLLPLEMGNNDLHVISTNNSTKTISDVSTHNALDASGGRKTPNKSPNRRIPRKERNGENRGNLKKEESKSSTKNYKEQYASSADASKEEAPTKEKRATNLVEEEEALLAAHRKVIQNTMNILDEEMNLLVQIDQPGSLINRYVAELSSVLSRKAADLASLQEHVMKFQQGL